MQSSERTPFARLEGSAEAEEGNRGSRRTGEPLSLPGRVACHGIGDESVDLFP